MSDFPCQKAANTITSDAKPAGRLARAQMRHVQSRRVFKAFFRRLLKVMMVIEQKNWEVLLDKFGHSQCIDSSISVVAMTEKKGLTAAGFRACDQFTVRREVPQDSGSKLPNGPHCPQFR